MTTTPLPPVTEFRLTAAEEIAVGDLIRLRRQTWRVTAVRLKEREAIVYYESVDDPKNASFDPLYRRSRIPAWKGAQS